MNLTASLKSWLVENCDVKSDATDDEFTKAAGTALASGELSPVKFSELSVDPDAEKSSAIEGKIDKLTDAIGSMVKGMTDAQKPAPETTPETKTVETPEVKAPEVPATKAKVQPSELAKTIARIGGQSALDIDGKETSSVRVKGVMERYADTKTVCTYPATQTTKSGGQKPHPFAGQPVKDYADGRVLHTGSEKDLAIAGAFGKFMVKSAQLGSRGQAFGFLSPHDQDLMHYALENEKWGGASDGGDYADIKGRKLTPHEQKALIDDATSGGLEAAPIAFDDLVIQVPFLHGELFPQVNTIPLDRGRRVEGVSVGRVTGAWGGVDDTAISLFNTAAYVSAFDTTIFRWEGAIRVGLDFLSDTPIDFGGIITTQYGERLLEDLDDVIAAGNGTTQPEGIINKSGTTSVAFGASESLGSYESLRFGVAKPEHKGPVGNTAVFCGTETSYQRARALPVGAADARRLGGMDYSSYSWMERDYKINETLTNAQIFYAVLGRYRMYRRRGFTMRSTTEGDTLVRNNSMLMTATARYGGQLERGGAAAITTTATA